MQRYLSDATAATAELLTLLAVASGCEEETVTAEQVEEGEADQLVAKISDALVKYGGHDPFHARGRELRSFQPHFVAFWSSLLDELQLAERLFDETLCDRLSDVLIAMSCNAVRSLRFTATLTASRLLAAWCSALAGLQEARATMQSQLEAEEKKGGKAVQERVKQLRRELERCHRRVQDANSHVNNLFQAVFAVRYRDVCPEIRAFVIQGYGAGMTCLPGTLLVDQYLKYPAWALSDRDPLVRSAALDVLLGLYRQPGNLEQMHEFTNR